MPYSLQISPWVLLHLMQIVSLLKQASKVIDADRLWVNPDCGLKTRQWKETFEALDNMVKSAKLMRETVY